MGWGGLTKAGRLLWEPWRSHISPEQVQRELGPLLWAWLNPISREHVADPHGTQAPGCQTQLSRARPSHGRCELISTIEDDGSRLVAPSEGDSVLLEEERTHQSKLAQRLQQYANRRVGTLSPISRHSCLCLSSSGWPLHSSQAAGYCPMFLLL